MPNKRQVWVITAIFFIATCVHVAIIYYRWSPRPFATAPVQWSILIAWLFVPLIAVWRETKERSAEAATSFRCAARLAILGYFGMLAVMWLMISMLMS
jgi:hypothetical protein